MVPAGWIEVACSPAGAGDFVVEVSEPGAVLRPGGGRRTSAFLASSADWKGAAQSLWCRAILVVPRNPCGAVQFLWRGCIRVVGIDLRTAPRTHPGEMILRCLSFAQR
jgi:hypothetical protein